MEDRVPKCRRDGFVVVEEEPAEQHRGDHELRPDGQCRDAQDERLDAADRVALRLRGHGLSQPQAGFSGQQQGEQCGEQEHPEAAGLDEADDDDLTEEREILTGVEDDESGDAERRGGREEGLEQ